jgi:tetratricopeptide (TPR) repeat protein
VEAAPSRLVAHFGKGQILRVHNRYAEAIPEYEIAIALNRNWVNALGPLAECKLFTGSVGEMIPLVERAIHLSPRDAQIAILYFRIGLGHLLQSRIDHAIVWLQTARASNAELPYVHSHLAGHAILRSAALYEITYFAGLRKAGVPEE